VSDVERDDRRRAALEQDVGESARRRANIEGFAARGIDSEGIERACQLDAAAADIRMIRRGELDARVGGESLRVVFSGDTGIDPAYWGGQALVKAWARFMGTLLARDPGRRLFWFLISKGYRTYLYLPLFFHEFYPRVDALTPAFERELITTLGTLKYPGDFDPTTGVIEFGESHGHLQPVLADTPSHRREHPHVRFFLERNPGFARGNELVCVAEISPGNMRGLARRMLREGAETLEAAS